MVDKAFSEFDETYFKKMLENNSVYFEQQLKKKRLHLQGFGISKCLKRSFKINSWAKKQ